MSKEALIARYCFHAVDAVDAFALGDESGVSDALALVKGDVQVLSDAVQRESEDLERFLTEKARHRDVTKPSRAAWRLAHTPDRCLAADEALEQLRLEELNQLQHSKWRTSSAWAYPASSLDVRFFVTIQTPRDDLCVNHLILETRGMFSRAFTSDCETWDPDYNFFLVNVTVSGAKPFVVRLRDFALLSRSGKAILATDVRDQAESPDGFWGSKVKIRSGDEYRRFMVFDAPNLRVRALGLEIRDKLFVIAFDSKERLQGPRQ